MSLQSRVADMEQTDNTCVTFSFTRPRIIRQRQEVSAGACTINFIDPFY